MTFVHLTRFEIETAKLVAQGKSNREIANSLGICESTAKWYVSEIMRKRFYSNRTQLALWALKEYNVEIPQHLKGGSMRRTS